MDDRERTYLPRDDRRAQLLAVALRLFSAAPFDQVSIDDIAREAGISKGLLYHYFGGKRGLYLAVIERSAGELLAAVVPDPGRPGVENARRGLEAYLRFVAARADAFLALLGADSEVQAVLEGTRQAIASQVLVAAGMDASVPALRVASRAWLGAVEAASVDWLKHRDVEEAALVDLLAVSLYVHLLTGARQAPQGSVKGDLLAGLPLLAGLTR